MEKILEIKDLHVSFKLDEDTARAIHGVNLSIGKGMSLGVVGESGCGKTVTAMSVIRLLPRNAIIEKGEILYKGKNILNYSQKKIQSLRGDKIALIPQDPLTSLNPLYTIGDQITEVITEHLDLSGQQAKELAIETLKSVKIPEAEDRFNDYPHQFSGGMRQRAIIAMALCCNPELIIADEPTTALDVTVQAQILNLIKSVQQKHNTSLLLITHDLGVVAEVCDHVTVMYAGRIIEYSDVRSVFNKPLHPYTIGLMESLPTTRDKKLKAIPGQPPSITEEINGCPFYARCPYKFEVCLEIDPPLIEYESGHWAACHLYNHGKADVIKRKS